MRYLDKDEILKKFDMPSDIVRLENLMNYYRKTESCDTTAQTIISVVDWIRRPVLFEPSVEMFNEMRNVDIHLKVDEYQQSYSSIMIKHPNSQQYSLVSMLTNGEEKILIISHTRLCEDKSGGRYTFVLNLNGNVEYKGGNYDIEDRLRQYNDDLPEQQLEVGYVNRVCMNVCLLLASHPSRRERIPYEKVLQKQLKIPTKRDEAQKKLDDMPQLIKFVNEPIYVDESSKKQSEIDGGGWTVRPHWRRGHFRSQRYGEGRLQRKTIFIKRMFINFKDRQSVIDGGSIFEIREQKVG